MRREAEEKEIRTQAINSNSLINRQVKSISLSTATFSFSSWQARVTAPTAALPSKAWACSSSTNDGAGAGATQGLRIIVEVEMEVLVLLVRHNWLNQQRQFRLLRLSLGRSNLPLALRARVYIVQYLMQ